MSGGYGIVVPWGGVGVGSPSPPVSTAGQVTYLGILEATTGAIAESDNEIGGFELTRLTAAHAAGSTTLNVESTYGWPDTGKIGLDGIVYYYTGRTNTTLTGITHIAGGASVAGTAIDHRDKAALIEVSLQRSALERLRRSFLVRYAEDEDLNVIGRNLGVKRIPLFGGDTQYRRIISAMAYCPKGTVQSLHLLMTELVGAGNYEIYEDLIRHRNTVFIKIASSIIVTDLSAGKTFFGRKQWAALSGAADTLTLSRAPISVGCVKLKDLGEVFDFRSAIPSAVVYPYWEGEIPANAFTYAGSVAEGTGVIQVAGLYTRFLSNILGGTVYYNMLDTQGARITPESKVECEATLAIPTGSVLVPGDLEQISLQIADGAFLVRAGVNNLQQLGLFATPGGGFLGSYATLVSDQFYNVTVKKLTSTVELWVDGVLVDSQPYSAFTAVTANHRVSFGLLGSPAANAEVRFKQLALDISNTLDVWSAREAGTGQVNTAQPVRLALSGSGHTFVAGDVGKGLAVSNSGITNSYGGNNNGNWLIDSIVSSAIVALIGQVRAGASLSTAAPKRVEALESEAFVYPDDLGKTLVISGSLIGNNGTYIIEKLLQPGTLTDYSTFSTPMRETTNICEVVTASFITEDPVNWRMDPAFATETGLDWVEAAAGTVAGAVLTLRQALWANNLVLEINDTDVLSAQLLADTSYYNEVIDPGPPPLYEFYPFYLSDLLGL